MAKAPEKTEVTTAMAVPDYLKNTPVNPSSDVDSLASSSLSIPRVSLRGKKFRVMADGEEVIKPSTQLEAIILAVEPGPGLFIKTFYEGTYNPNDTSPPSCSSSNGVHPDAWVTAPVSDRCNTCPNNRFGSATSNSGKKAKACKDSKRIWLTLPDDISGTVYALGIPVTSLRNVSEYAKHLKSHNYPITATVTRLSMDEDGDFPMLNFEVARFLDEADYHVATERSAARDWDIAAATTAPMLENREGAKPQALPSMSTVIDQTNSSMQTEDGVGKW